MNTYIALFRGINVGGNNILLMKDLAAVLKDLGCRNVKTYIQSGNVVFKIKPSNTNKLAEEISSRILHKFGFEPKVLLLELTEIQTAIDNNPFPTDVGKALHFFFAACEPVSPDLEQLSAIKFDAEEFKLIGKVFYLFTPDGTGRSKLAAKVEKCLGVPVTARNWNTVNKLISLADKK